jgi:ATP-binding cassette subfamily C protein LapB
MSGAPDAPTISELTRRLEGAYGPVPARPDPVAAALNRAPDDDRLRLADFFKGHAGIYGQAVVATGVINLLALAGSLVVMNVYDRVLPNNAMETLTALVIGACLAALFEFALRMLRAGLIDAASREIDTRLAAKLYARVIGAKLQGGAGSTGVRINTLREFETLRDFFTSATLTALGDVPFAILFILIIAIVAGPLVWVPLAMIPLLIVLQLALQKPLARLTAESFRDTAQKNAVLVETLVGIETVKGIGADSWAQSLWDRSVAEHVRVGLRTRFLNALAQNAVGLAQTVAIMALLVYGAILIARGEITGGALIAAMTLIGRAIAPIAQGTMMVGRIHQIRVAWQALAQLANAPQERPAGADFVTPARAPAAIAFEHVTFGYAADAPPALKDVSFTIKAGERVGMIGAIGCGKSTTLKLMLKLHTPISGRVLINGLAAEGVDPDWLRRHTAYLDQQPTLFSGTIRSNLILHRQQASDEDVLRACDQAGALAWINRLPRGFDSRLGERGAGLSSGQRQSLALARALIGAPSLIIMDEPTSDMDGRSESDIVRRLASGLAGRTLILVTHRPALLDLVDRLIVFDNGQVMADGPKAQVLELLTRRSAERDAAARSEARA